MRMTVHLSLAPGNLAVGMEDSVWTASVDTHVPALQDSLESTVREISTNVCLGPAKLLGASTVCSWSTTTSASVALDTRVPQYCLVNLNTKSS